MSVSLDKLALQLNSNIISGGQNVINTARLVGSVESLETIYSVANTASLPTASDNTGRFIYVEDIGAYRYSDGIEWTNDYDTTLTATSGQLWVWGTNHCGQLGDGTTVTKCSPVREFCSATDWRSVSISRNHTAAIKTSGQIWSWGCNDGRLGAGTTVTTCSPVREISSSTDWCQVSAGFYHTAAIKTSGQIWSWGQNAGALGDGIGAPNTCSPVREICSATDWCQVGAGSGHTAAVKTSGELWMWGYNACGQLGDGSTTTKRSPVREISSSTDWCQVDGGFCHTAAVKTSGQLWSWGTGTCGVLGDGSTTTKCSPVREISSSTDWCGVSAGGIRSTIAIKTSGQIWGWGSNSSGRLGNGSTTGFTSSPVREICSATDWCQVDGGAINSAAVKTSGELWTWGINGCGALGIGLITTSSSSPVREHSSATDWCQVSVGSQIAAAVKITKGFNEP